MELSLLMKPTSISVRKKVSQIKSKIIQILLLAKPSAKLGEWLLCELELLMLPKKSLNFTIK